MAWKLRRLGLLLAAMGLVLVLSGTSLSRAATPTNSNDPCAQNGRDTCNTTGVGGYHNYPFGLRWFGDYRNAIPGVSGATFCIDLNFWFPGRNYGYRKASTSGLKNKAGAAVSAATLAKISYAIWNDGRSSSADQQGATMLYVHGQMNDAPKAQVAPNSIGAAVNGIYSKIQSAADRYAGPYTVKVAMGAKLNAGSSETATVEVISAAGSAVPNVTFGLNANGATVPSTVTSGSNGVAKVSVTATSAPETLKLTANATNLAANAPTLYVPTSGSSASNGQRLVVPTSQSVSGADSTAVALVTPTVSTAATPATLNVGSTDADQVTIASLPTGAAPNVTVNLYGPAASQGAITCTGTPVQSVSFAGTNGATTSPNVTPTQAGYYGYQVVIAGTATSAAVTSPCAPSGETFQANLYSPNITSQATPANVNIGGTDADAVTLSGLPADQSPTVTVNLYGPAASQGGIDCTGTPVQSVTFPATNGTVNTPAVTPPAVGWYGYQVVVPATAESNGTTSPCAPATESFDVTTTPTVHTQVSSTTVAPGAALSDTVIVAGLSGQPATVTADLYGPFATPSAAKCTGTPTWTGTIPVSADGTYQTASTTLKTPGYYVYNESIAASGFVQAAGTTCAENTETTLVTAAPAITTKVSNATVAPGSTLQDHAAISGLGVLTAKVHVNLYGPYSSSSAITCTGKPVWSQNFTANGNGTYLTAKAPIKQAGYYVYNESIGASTAYPFVATACADAAETSIAKPAPVIGTIPSASVVKPGSAIFDHIRVSGVGSTPITIGVSLYGPFASLSDVSCSHSAAWTGTVHASGDGEVHSGSYTISKVGFYVYRESIDATGLVPAVSTPCANLPETVLGEPEIITGPGAPVFAADTAPLSNPAGDVPTSMTIPSLHISAPIQREAISIKTGQMAIPANVHRVGWWQDGAVPADASGTTLVFGHINYTGQGPGAFFQLAQAGIGKLSVTGDLVSVRTANGKLYSYRITSVSRMLKANLPAGVFTKQGSRKLVMVTCGGAFDAKTKHYVDNVVVTAVPA